MDINHRIRFKSEHIKNNTKHEYVCKTIIFSLFTHGNYPTTVFNDTNETVFLEMLALKLDYHQRAPFYEENLSRKTDFHVVFLFQTNSIS